MTNKMPTIANFQMPDNVFDLIKDYSETDELNINYSFEGDWGNWNWLYNKIIEDFVHNNPDYHVIKKSDVDGDVMGALDNLYATASSAWPSARRERDNDYQAVKTALIAQSDPYMVRIPRTVLEGMVEALKYVVSKADKDGYIYARSEEDPERFTYMDIDDAREAINDVLNYKEVDDGCSK